MRVSLLRRHLSTTAPLDGSTDCVCLAASSNTCSGLWPMAEPRNNQMTLVNKIASSALTSSSMLGADPEDGNDDEGAFRPKWLELELEPQLCHGE